ncbi:hypothetical protein M501DRAFT_998133 [Patellaria atrata CBS 101060]|uniref:Uncharacterized protein n=1 Tax=Patellaria atrata CBS 101060 TaxID=1346257 RepID=A0A9P4SG68_9PEZI|nr:hypothetical protein M501DRAFT_998133 [Patellaria atrata CBS 101060]
MAPLLSLISQALALAALVRGAASTSLSDSWRDADVGQSGYVGGGHGLDPAVVDSAQFKELWASHFGKTEKHYAKPLVYTLSAGQQVLFLASTANIIRTIDAKTGELLNYRQVAEPFPLAEVYCTGIAEWVHQTTLGCIY